MISPSASRPIICPPITPSARISAIRLMACRSGWSRRSRSSRPTKAASPSPMSSGSGRNPLTQNRLAPPPMNLITLFWTRVCAMVPTRSGTATASIWTRRASAYSRSGSFPTGSPASQTFPPSPPEWKCFGSTEPWAKKAMTGSGIRAAPCRSSWSGAGKAVIRFGWICLLRATNWKRPCWTKLRPEASRRLPSMAITPFPTALGPAWI